MTTYLYQDDCFYADTRAYVNGQPFNISGKIVPLTEPIRMKATVDKGSVKPIVLDDTIYGYFVTHAVEPGRALFDTMVESAKQSDGDVQNVLDNHRLFIEVFKLAAYSSHFALTLIGEKGTYTISTPLAIDRDYVYEYSPYVHETSGGGMGMAYGANQEFLMALIQANMPPIMAYYTLFCQHTESGGNVEVWRLRMFKGKKFLVRDRWYPEVTPDKMLNAIHDWREDPKDFPIPEMTAVYNYGPELLSAFRVEKYLQDKGYAMMRDDREIVTHLVPKSGKPIDIREPSKRNEPTA